MIFNFLIIIWSRSTLFPARNSNAGNLITQDFLSPGNFGKVWNIWFWVSRGRHTVWQLLCERFLRILHGGVCKQKNTNTKLNYITSNISLHMIIFM